ncbi:MAG: hypothetical protein ABII79_12635 [bacterium]
MVNRKGEGGLLLSGQLINVLTVVLGIAAAYFLTIQSLRIELEAKAESTVVEVLDKKLAGFEVILKEGVVSREQFFQFSKDVEARLTRIEYYVKEQPREDVSKP